MNSPNQNNPAPRGANESRADASSLHGRIERQRQLPFRKTVAIAWMNIRVRLGRSLLVTSGIILAIAFLTYMMSSDALGRAVTQKGAPQRIEQLQRDVQQLSAKSEPALERTKKEKELAHALEMQALVDRLMESGKLTSLNDADARIQTRWMVGLALLVSFVGILNAMLLSVTERFSEIGTMKCLGALDRLIVELFLLESFFQGLVGTGLGVIIGLALAVTEGIRTYGGALWSLLSFEMLAPIIGICVLAGVGLTIAGALYPAWRAAKMQPVAAMRTEV